MSVELALRENKVVDGQLDDMYKKCRATHNQDAEFHALSEYLGEHLKNLKTVTFWLRLTREQLNNAICQPFGLPEWIKDCRQIKAEKVIVNLLICPRIWPVSSELYELYHDGWCFVPRTERRTGNWADGKTFNDVGPASNAFVYTNDGMEEALAKQITGVGLGSLTDDVQDDMGIAVLHEGFPVDEAGIYLKERRDLVGDTKRQLEWEKDTGCWDMNLDQF